MDKNYYSSLCNTDGNPAVPQPVLQAAELSLQIANEQLQLVRHVYDDSYWANSM